MKKDRWRQRENEKQIDRQRVRVKETMKEREREKDIMRIQESGDSNNERKKQRKHQ